MNNSFTCLQCEQIGLLLKSLGYIFSCKINPKIGQLSAILKISLYTLKLLSFLFWSTLVKIGLLLILASGHTACLDKSKQEVSCTAVLPSYDAYSLLIRSFLEARHCKVHPCGFSGIPNDHGAQTHSQYRSR